MQNCDHLLTPYGGCHGGCRSAETDGYTMRAGANDLALLCRGVSDVRVSLARRAGQTCRRVDPCWIWRGGPRSRARGDACDTSCAQRQRGSRFSCVFVSRVCVLCAALLPRAPQPRARAPVCMGYPTRKKSIHMRHDDTGLMELSCPTCVIFLQVQKPELCVPAPTRFQRLRFQHCKASPSPKVPVSGVQPSAFRVFVGFELTAFRRQAAGCAYKGEGTWAFTEPTPPSAVAGLMI